MKEKERNDFFLHKELEGNRCCELFVICMDNKIYSYHSCLCCSLHNDMIAAVQDLDHVF